MAISNLVLTQQIYSEEPNGAHAHYREPVPLTLSEFARHEFTNLWLETLPDTFSYLSYFKELHNEQEYY